MSPRLRTLLAFLYAVIGVVVLFQLAFAAGPVMWQENGVPVCVAPAFQWWPHAVPDGKGGAIIVWEDDRVDGYTDLYGQRLDCLGVPLWCSGGVTVAGGNGTQYRHAAASDGKGGAVVAWWNEPLGGSDDSIRVQHLSSNGTVDWNTAGVTVYQRAHQWFDVHITEDGDGGAIIGWERTDTITATGEIRAQRVSSNGVVTWLPEGVGLTTLDSVDLELVPDGTGGVIMGWAVAPSGQSQIIAQRLDGDGNRLWYTDGLTVSDDFVHFDQDIASDGLGGALVAWSGALEFDDPHIYATKLGPDGAFVWGSDWITVCAPSGIQQRSPSIVSDGAGGAVVAWQDYRSGSGGTGWDIYAQRVLSDGNTAWQVDGVAVCTVADQQENPQIVPHSHGGATVVWEDRRSDPFAPDIYAQQIDGEGHLVWQAQGVPLCTADDSQHQFCMVVGGGEGAIVAWNDWRSGEVDVYAQGIVHFSRLAHLPQVMHD